METTIDKLQKFLIDVQMKCMYSNDKELQKIGFEALKIREDLISNGMEDFIHEIKLK